MASRRTHTKTKTGCYNCKKRHIKCDRLGLPCANCQVRGSECSQSAPAEPLRSTSEPLIDSSSPETAFHSNALRLLEMELIHKWSTHTCWDLNLVVNDTEIWQITVPQDAFTHDYLLEAILAVASLHMAITTAPEKAILYHTKALQYQNQAIANFKAKALPVKSSNHQALFAFSIVVLVLAFAIPRHSPQDKNNRSMLANLKTVFSLLQGTTLIFRSAKVWLQHSPFGKIVTQYHQKEACSMEDATREAFLQLKRLGDAEYVSLDASATASPSDLVIRRETNLKAIDWLQQCFLSDPSEAMLRCLTWLATLDPEFMRSVEQGEPFALLITMHWAILLHYCGESRWWAQSSGKILITELYRTLAPYKPAWLPQMAWICQQVGLPVLG